MRRPEVPEKDPFSPSKMILAGLGGVPAPQPSFAGISGADLAKTIGNLRAPLLAKPKAPPKVQLNDAAPALQDAYHELAKKPKRERIYQTSILWLGMGVDTAVFVERRRLMTEAEQTLLWSSSSMKDSFYANTFQALPPREEADGGPSQKDLMALAGLALGGGGGRTKRR